MNTYKLIIIHPKIIELMKKDSIHEDVLANGFLVQASSENNARELAHKRLKITTAQLKLLILVSRWVVPKMIKEGLDE